MQAAILVTFSFFYANKMQQNQMIGSRKFVFHHQHRPLLQIQFLPVSNFISYFHSVQIGAHINAVSNVLGFITKYFLRHWCVYIAQYTVYINSIHYCFPMVLKQLDRLRPLVTTVMVAKRPLSRPLSIYRHTGVCVKTATVCIISLCVCVLQSL